MYIVLDQVIYRKELIENTLWKIPYIAVQARPLKRNVAKTIFPVNFEKVDHDARLKTVLMQFF